MIDELCAAIVIGFLGFVALAIIMAGLDYLTGGISTGIIALITILGTGIGFLCVIGLVIQEMFGN